MTEPIGIGESHWMPYEPPTVELLQRENAKLPEPSVKAAHLAGEWDETAAYAKDKDLGIYNAYSQCCDQLRFLLLPLVETLADCDDTKTGVPTSADSPEGATPRTVKEVICWNCGETVSPCPVCGNEERREGSGLLTCECPAASPVAPEGIGAHEQGKLDPFIERYADQLLATPVLNRALLPPEFSEKDLKREVMGAFRAAIRFTLDAGGVAPEGTRPAKETK